jgi:ABC-type nitrate/sulfonate/bicarbonate transport system substrate-binding protein
VTLQAHAASVVPAFVAPAGQTLWIARDRTPSAVVLAQTQGWFEAEFERDGFAVHALRDADPAPTGLFRDSGNVPALRARASGLHDTAIIGLTWIEERQALLSVPGSGLRGPHGLKGARLGLPKAKGESADAWRAVVLRAYTSALVLAGLTLQDVTLVDIDVTAWNDFDRPRSGGTWPAAAEQALLNGQVDVIYAKGASVEALRRRNDLDVVFDLGAYPDRKVVINNAAPRPLTVDREFLAEHPDIVARYLAVLLDASTWATTRPEQVRRIMAREADTDEESIIAAYGTELHHRLGVDLSEERVAALESQKAFLRDLNLISGDVDIPAWICREPLEEAKRLILTGARSARLVAG